MRTRIKELIMLAGSIFCAVKGVSQTAEFNSQWHDTENRVWIGENYWANPLEDWHIKNGQLECLNDKGKRSVHLITHQLKEDGETLNITLELGNLTTKSGKAGIELGLKSELRNEYRFNAIWGKGIEIGIDEARQKLYCFDQVEEKILSEEPMTIKSVNKYSLEVHIVRKRGDSFTVRVTVTNATGDMIGHMVKEGLPANYLIGNVSLFSRGSYWFGNWQLKGNKLEQFLERAWGPILWTQYTLSRGILTVSAQLAPVIQAGQELTLEIKEDNQWKPVGRALPDPLSRTAIFRINEWDDGSNHKFRIVYPVKEENHFWEGTIRKDPVDKQTVSVAGFTGHKDYNYPNPGVVSNVLNHDPDLLFFSGDQIYEQNGGYNVVRKPLEKAMLSYLGKYYLFGWSFGYLMRDRPSVVIPDDHDVFVGNIWGDNGKGYVMPAEWVNAVQRTQTGNLPPAFDPTPVENGIEVYYTDLLYGRVSFSILEDRKFKSQPTSIPPAVRGTKGRPDHVNDPAFDPMKINDPSYKLLGKRQLNFLDNWASDWKGTDMKVCLSQSTFAGIATHHGPGSLPLIADYDANGWPQYGRDEALRKLRKGFAFMFAGDTHLPTVVKHGVDTWSDAGWAFCVPSIAAGYPRSWIPQSKGGNHQKGMPNYTGDYLDGFGNKITVWAAANPEISIAHREAAKSAGDTIVFNQKRSGYGIMKFDKASGDAIMECYGLNSGPGDKQMEGWPLKANMLENDGREAVSLLPELNIIGLQRPVVQIIDEEQNEVVYTIRLTSTVFSPKVYKHGLYTIKVGNPDVDEWQVIRRLNSKKTAEKKITIRFKS